MKKYFALLTLLLCMGHSSATERIIAHDIEVMQGGQAFLVVDMDFDATHDYVSYQMTVELPDGISLVSEDGENALFTLPYNQPGDKFKVTDFPLANGILKVASMPSTVIADHQGTLVVIPVKADAGLTVGTELDGRLSGVVFSHKNSDAEYLADASFKVTISDRVILDESLPVAPLATDGEVSLLVKRTVKAGEWSTLCLPFDMDGAEVRRIFGDDVELAEFDSYEKNEDGTIQVSFVDADLDGEGFYGNWPYIIRTSRNVSEFETVATVVSDEDGAVAEYTVGSGKKKRTVGTFTGTLHAGTLIPENCLFLSNNKFYYSVGKSRCKAFRAYFWLEDLLSERENAASRITMAVQESEPTVISTVRTAQAGEVYDLQGRRVAEPVNGLYIKGKKTMIFK